MYSPMRVTQYNLELSESVHVLYLEKKVKTNYLQSILPPFQ